MALRSIKLLINIRNASINRLCFMSSSPTFRTVKETHKINEIKTEENLTYLEDPDTFGTLSRKIKTYSDVFEDEGDIIEHKYLQEQPLPSQRFTIKQYSDIIKQFIKYKRLKEAIDVLEVRMLKEDRVKPDNYIYNILIGACADVGYTKKAFKLYNDMKRRALKATGDTYTCLFHACAKSPWPHDGLKNATHLREFMIQKGIEPNLTNYNSMIKAFGRCGDLSTAFKIVDEMISKKIKIRVHTFNHLLQACISNEENGLRHALIVWRKMLKLREKPNIYSFNLMLKCVKDCNLGTKTEIEELIGFIQGQIALEHNQAKYIEGTSSINNNLKLLELPTDITSEIHSNISIVENKYIDKKDKSILENNNNELTPIENPDDVKIELLTNISKIKTESRTVPNLLSKSLEMHHVMSLQEVHTVQEKFAVVGGQDDFLREMKVWSVKPDIKTFTQMIPLLDETREAESKLLDKMKNLQIIADIDFYNMLIKKRCFRKDYEGALNIKELIEEENKFRKKKYPLKKKLILKANIMTYGVMAMACRTKECAENLLAEMKEKQIKVNIEILGSLLRQATTTSKFGYILYVMNIVKEEKVPVSKLFLQHLEEFNDKCENIIKQDDNGQRKCTEVFVNAYKMFSYAYKKWLKESNVAEVLTPEHPWKQFSENYPETIQRQSFVIEEPKKFYKSKRNRKFLRYAPGT